MKTISQKITSRLIAIFSKPKPIEYEPELHKLTHSDLMFAIDTNTFFDEEDDSNDDEAAAGVVCLV